MSHLKIEQNTSSVEVISSTIIDKLYELALSGTLDSSSDLKGNLLVTHAYQDAIDYLLNKFPSLQINVTGGAYIRFADSAVASICATNWGDGNAITQSQASVINTLNSKFKTNTNIILFNELKYFLNIKWANTSEFQGCTNLISIDISNITGLAANSFQGCTNLKYIGKLNVTELYGHAQFANCSELIGMSESEPYINLSTLKVINGNAYVAFSRCIKLTRVILPNDFTVTSKYMFEYCSSLVTVDNSDKLSFVREGMFSNCTAIQSIILSNLCTYIETNAFNGCSSLTNIGDLSRVVTLGGGAFQGCTSLLELIFSSLTNILSDGAFRDCTKLVSVTGLNNIVLLPSSSFINDAKLTNLDFDALTTINQSAFANCAKLTTLGNLSNVTTIGGSAFGSCSVLNSINLSNKCTSIGSAAFQNCLALTSIGDTSGIITLGGSCFRGCSAIVSLNLISATDLGSDNTFNGCVTLTTVILNSALTIIKSNVFANCYLLSSIDLSNIVTIQGGAFQSCKALTSINLQSIVSIGSHAFDSCIVLAKVTIGSSCTNLSDYTFWMSTAIQYIKCLSVVPPTMNGRLISDGVSCKIYVPDDSVAAYKAATNWSAYASRIFSLTQFAIDFPNG